MLQEPNSFSTAVHGLLSCQRQALAIRSNAGGEHLCFLGCGELENDRSESSSECSVINSFSDSSNSCNLIIYEIHSYYIVNINTIFLKQVLFS